MGQRAAAGTGSQGRALAWAARFCLVRPLALLLLLAGLTFSQACRADDPVRGEATFTAGGGFARLVLKLAEDVESDVTTAGSIIIIRFKRPVDIPVDKLSDAVPDYVGPARRDPDGTAIRLSLARRATVNTMTAAERIFVDFLPDSWTGPPPPLPSAVVRELAERARAAERALRAQLAVAAAKKRPPVRVRASVQPTFVRFVFEVPEGVNVSSVLNEQKLTLQFNSVLNFDLADAKVAAPPNVASISQRADVDSSAVDILLIGEVDVHSFREEKNYVIDVAFQQAEKPAALAEVQAAAKPIAPAKPGPTSRVSRDKALKESPPPQQPAEIPPATSEMIAEQAKIEIKPPQVTDAPAAATTPAVEKSMPAGDIATPASEKLAAAPQKSSAPAEAAKATQRAEQIQATAAEVPKPIAMPVEPPKTAAPVASNPTPESGAKAAAIEARRDSDGLHVTFSFAAPTPAALFRRADTVWLVFDHTKPIDIEPIRSKAGAIIGDVSRLPLEKGQAIRIRLNRPQIPSLESESRSKGAEWTLTFADRGQTPQLPLTVLRNITDPALANVTVPLTNPGAMHRLVDPDAGDTLLIVTAAPPTRGLIKRHDFVELSLLESVHGVAVHPNSDDINAEVGSDKVMLGRPGGLTLSSADVSAERATAAVRPLFDANEWRKNREEKFFPRLDALIKAAATAGPEQKSHARLDLANFYMSRGMYQEARGMTNLILSESNQGTEDPAVVMVHAVASILIGHPEQALKDLANPAIGNGYDSQLWKGFAFARQEKWADAREKFKNAEFSIAALPLELQRIVAADAMRASLEVKDYGGASRRRSELEVIGVPSEMKPEIAVLRGRLAEALGHDKDALDAYRFAVQSRDRQASAEARLLQALLRHKRGELGQAELISELEALSVIWRGDTIELKALNKLTQLYAESGRYADALGAAKTATKLQPNSELSRQAQDAASALFSELYLGPKGDEMKPVDALAMFYEYRELTPIGRRGDEMIRRLADRLAAIDLLDQAAELLQYQVDKRLEGAARAQVAARLAMVYLTARKPDRAITALRLTRIADLSGELRQQRLLLEARAQSDVGRHDLALDIISNITGREAIRLRSDIYWASRQWREASEQIELYYGDRWRDFKPLNAIEKSDMIRAVVGYALAEDAIGLARFREKYAPLMTGEADRFAFDTASKPAASSSAEFSEIARMAASVDTLDGFIREMKVRFPDATARAPGPPETSGGEPVHTGALPAIVGVRKIDLSKRAK
ncbi:tetratricopeptide repeat protein [Bradyrhizobium sp. WSM 1738]|uniref:tetratricopeptide repeat protein n=1 Tax=Bradyrhizobium hereditatis TaxID=2821405 RepID=UPI001CE3779F|nr:tetratricopeptide repeat protein [Bradyrhizobium hereditatis]MCA6116674.1 tetratricopeptide repeat protein [Bradyrhizobium hereditatis]